MASATESDPGRHIPMHPLEFQVLLILMDGELHGYGIAKEIERRDASVGRVLPTNLYRRLRDLGEKGIVTEASDPDHGPRRIFRITPFGRRVARSEAERLDALVTAARRRRLLVSGPEEG
ncbi:MAG: PadR family transcriptional regulator [Gemmatimonadetes bacterium]|nr:PadR family transcriptional regulator [Gemmatimonadota bacterium]